ncbi:MAG: hypothetical protein SGARI_002353, partial [Bacillariaceae sp.]
MEKDDPTVSMEDDGSPVVVKHVTATEIDKFGYGVAQPDSAKVDKYGYGEAAPDSAIDYGYGEAAPDSPNRTPSRRTPRRSSMKGSSCRAGRRASVGAVMSTVEVRLPGNKPLRRRRSITFQENVDVKQVEPVKSLAEEPEKLWFKDNEYDLMRTKIMTMIDHIQMSGDPSGIDEHGGISVNGKTYCYRGLENYFNPELAHLKTVRARGSVMDEQFLQREEGDFDEETMASIYKLNSMRSQREASQRACQDAE